jgi:glutathione S-transferase
MATLQVLGIPQSTFTRAVRMAVLEKGIPYEFIVAPPHSPEAKAIHPAGKIPVMRYGDLTMFESRAIAHYVDDHFPGPSLTPRTAAGDALVEQWISYHNTVVDPLLIRKYVLAGHVFPNTPDKSPDRALVAELQPGLAREAAVLDKATAGGFLVGDRFTLADIFLMPTLFSAHRFPDFGALMKQAPNLQRYYERHAERESFRATMPPPPPAKS